MYYNAPVRSVEVVSGIKWLRSHWGFAGMAATNMKDGLGKRQRGLVAEIRTLKSRLAKFERNDDSPGQDEQRMNQVLLDTLPCVALLLRPQTREIMAMNGAARRAGAALGTPCFDSWMQCNGPCPGCLAPELWATGKTQHREFEARGIVWDAYWQPLSTDLYLHYAFDITERKLAEEELRRSERKYRDLQDASIDGHAWTDMNGRIIEANNAYKDMMGYTEEELSTLTYNDVTPARWHAFEREILTQQILPRGYSDVYEKELIRKDGTVFPAELRAYLAKDDEGRNIGMRAIVKDISERKRIEEQLVVFKRFAEASTQGLGIADLEGRIVYCNGTLGRTFLGEEDPQTVFGKHISCYYSENSAKILQEQILPRVLKTGRWTGELSLVSVDESVVEAIQSIFLMCNDRGEPAHYANVVTDISERKQLEELAKQHQAELAHATRLSTLGEMASGLAHEINQPLASILSHADLYLSAIESKKGDFDFIAEGLKEIATQAELAGNVTRRMRAFSRRQVSQRRLCEISDIAKEAIGLIQWEAKRDGMRIKTALTSAPAWVFADCIQLEQVVVNLIRNGLEAMHDTDTPGKDLVIEIHAVSDGYVELTVQDCGPGIPPDIRPTMFDPFCTSKSEGLGLGLTISERIVQQHGGRLRLASSDSSGTTMTIQLPVAEDRRD